MSNKVKMLSVLLFSFLFIICGVGMANAGILDPLKNILDKTPVVQDVSDVLGKPVAVNEITDLVGNLVDAVEGLTNPATDLVDNTVNSLTDTTNGLLDGTVGDVTDTVNNVLNDTTDTVVYGKIKIQRMAS